MCGETEKAKIMEGKDLTWKTQEAVGDKYVEAMKRSITLPCGGSTVVNGIFIKDPLPVGMSCAQAFCQDSQGRPRKPEPGIVESCKSDCAQHPDFCTDTCKDADDKGLGESSAECQSCRHECEQACWCSDFCTPLVLDAALCVEQGGGWGQRLSQNFDNIWNAMVTLFEISTTEGWVDVMYVAADNVGVYRQPERDASFEMWILFFVIWIFISFMFLLNLPVGCGLDK
jgi:hypothetical protein